MLSHDAHLDAINKVEFFNEDFVTFGVDGLIKYWKINPENKKFLELKKVQRSHWKPVSSSCIKNNILLSGDYEGVIVKSIVSEDIEEFDMLQTGKDPIWDIHISPKNTHFVVSQCDKIKLFKQNSLSHKPNLILSKKNSVMGNLRFLSEKEIVFFQSNPTRNSLVFYDLVK